MANAFFKGKIGNSIRLSASSVCQLKCPLCLTAQGLNRKGSIGHGFLKFSNFKKFVDRYRSIKNIELSHYGEIFLNPELSDIIKYAYLRNIRLTARTGANFNTINGQLIENIVKYRFGSITISIDGTDNKTYQTYRKNGDVTKVFDNIKKVNFFKKKYKTLLPRLEFQFIIFGHNEHQLPIARNIAKKLQMVFKPKLNSCVDYSPVINKDFVKKETSINVASREEYKQTYKKDYFVPCHQLWKEPQINWDGKLLGCCANTYSDFGNVFKAGLEECLNSEKYIYAKKILLGLKKPRKDIACSNCCVYHERVDPKQLLKNLLTP